MTAGRGLRDGAAASPSPMWERAGVREAGATPNTTASARHPRGLARA
jgi:hypothetical protein